MASSVFTKKNWPNLGNIWDSSTYYTTTRPQLLYQIFIEWLPTNEAALSHHLIPFTFSISICWLNSIGSSITVCTGKFLGRTTISISHTLSGCCFQFPPHCFVCLPKPKKQRVLGYYAMTDGGKSWSSCKFPLTYYSTLDFIFQQILTFLKRFFGCCL